MIRPRNPTAAVDPPVAFDCYVWCHRRRRAAGQRRWATMRLRNSRIVTSALSLATLASAFSVVTTLLSADASVDLSEARATDPTKLGWMVGAPPPADKMLRFADGSYYRFPQWRWTFSHWREFRPTVAVSRGTGPVQPLPSAPRTDLDAVTFMPLGGTNPMTWADSLVANYTDGILVLHRGRMVYE